MPKSRRKSKARPRAKSRARRKARAKPRTRPGFALIPPGFRTVTPYLAIDGAARALEFYKNAFGAKGLDRQATPDGKIVHARIMIGDCLVMMSDIFPGATAKSPLELGASSVTLHIYTKNLDEMWSKALAAGAKVVMPLDNQFWGERYGQLMDPFGHHWSLAMRVKMSKEEMEAKRKEAMAMFSQDQHPQK
ncbi:MAG: VOC family protein [Nitrososphaerales archaeon]|nr:VOC family protein [Nitrososphaerales archaeon]